MDPLDQKQIDQLRLEVKNLVAMIEREKAMVKELRTANERMQAMLDASQNERRWLRRLVEMAFGGKVEE